MTIHHATVIFPYTTESPEDVTVNNFWFTDGGGALGDAHAIIKPRLADYYDAIRSLYADIVDLENGTIKIRRPGVTGDPDFEQPFGVDAATAGQPMPLEVAICQSYVGGIKLNGDPPVLNKRRRRGRHYIGPLRSAVCLAEDTDTNLPVVGGTAISTLTDAAQALAAASDEDCAWITYSQTQGGSEGAHIITEGWVDHEFDTQRRRQVLPAVTRTDWTVILP